MVDISKCCMTRYPAAVLGKKTEPVEVFDDNLAALVEKMKDLMVEYKGVGLAGPQAGVGLSIFVASADATKENAKAYINPIITPSGKLKVAEEGCLSLPGVFGKVRRYSHCSIKAQDVTGKEFTEDADGLLARAFQHEFDHLNGTVIADKFSSVAKIVARKKLKKLAENYEA